MKPFTIVLTINLSFFAIWGLFFTLVVNRPEMIPLLTSLQAAINLLLMAGLFLDKKKQLAIPFIWGVLLSTAVTVVGYLLLIKYKHLIGVEEAYTTFLHITNPLGHWA